MSENKQYRQLLPVGQRVTHFDGGPHTHGKGTIVAYNTQEPIAYVEEKLDVAAELVADLKEKTGVDLMPTLITGFYSFERCPYVVHWDPSEKYPEGYKDVYEHESVQPIHEDNHG